MNIAEEANEVCKKAEGSLRTLMQKAIEAGEYRHLPTLARMAEQISTLGARITQPVLDQAPPTAENQGPHPRMRASRRRRANPKNRPRRADSGRKAAVPPSGLGYPKFERDGDTLIKIGWSKNSRTEYEHKAPRRVLDAFLRTILTIGDAGKSFTVENLLPLPDPADGTAIPAYQVYLVLAWARTEGLLQQHGRDGYSLFPTIDLERTVAERWTELPSRKKEE